MLLLRCFRYLPRLLLKLFLFLVDVSFVSLRVFLEAEKFFSLVYINFAIFFVKSPESITLHTDGSPSTTKAVHANTQIFPQAR